VKKQGGFGGEWSKKKALGVKREQEDGQEIESEEFLKRGRINKLR